MPELDPITGKDPSSLTVAQLAERLAMERALREQQAAFVAQALEKQASEYGRRLDELNHAHAQAVDAQARTVPRELFDQFVKENDSRREAAFGALGNRLEASIGSLADTVKVGHDALEAQIEVERNARRSRSSGTPASGPRDRCRSGGSSPCSSASPASWRSSSRPSRSWGGE